jgi:magnesium-transporting ATPase (P-type)
MRKSPGSNTEHEGMEETMEQKVESKRKIIKNRAVMLLTIAILMLIAIAILAVIYRSVWELIIPDIFVSDAMVKHQIDIFAAAKLVVFLSVFSLGVYSFQLIRNIIRLLKTNNIFKSLLFLLVIIIYASILGSITYLMWGWITKDIVSQMITDQISMRTSIVISSLFLLVISSDDILNELFAFLGITKR